MAPETTPRKNNIYLVDDHPLVREWLTKLINDQPDLAVCGEAETRPQAFEAILALKPRVAIVDISLRASSGLGLIEDLKRRCPEVAVLVLSMHEELQYAERALRAGARGYIIKRETSRKVIGAIRQVLQGQRYMSDTVAGAVADQSAPGGTRAPRSPADILGERELEVFKLLGQGHRTRQIAGMLGVSVKTIEAHCAHIKAKLHLANSTELLRAAVRWCDGANNGPH
jgi:DNA-binding NarL/FixJ family response regulator